MHPGNDAAPQPKPGFPPLDLPAPKVCGVCDERAKSHHFGGMACDSCKAFFRRSVQSEAYRHFRCSYDGCCHITISSRKCCQNCRFQKCLKIGMEKKWVMSEEERVHQDKMRKDRKRQRKEEEESRKCRSAVLTSGAQQTHERTVQISDEDRNEIEMLVKKFYDAYSVVPLEPEMSADARQPATTRVVGVFVNAVSRLVSFIATLPHFREVLPADQKILLKNGVLAVLILRGTMVYEASSSLFNSQGVGAKVGLSDLKSVLTPELMENHQRFVQRIQSLGLDKTTNMLLQMVVMFSSDLTGLTDPDTVARLQEHYTCLIRRYMSWSRGEETTRVLYPRMLHLLADLRALVEAHNMNTVCFPDRDMANVVDKFGKIELNPYPMWPEFGHDSPRPQQQQQEERRQQQQQQQRQQQQQQQRRRQQQQQTQTQQQGQAHWRRSSHTEVPARPAVPPSGEGVRPRHSSQPAASWTPHRPQTRPSASPQTPSFRAEERLLPPAGAQCIPSSPPAGAQYSAAAHPPASYAAGYAAPGCDPQGSPSPGAVPAQWPQWGADHFGSAGVNPFLGDLRQTRSPAGSRLPPTSTDCHRLPPGGDLANCGPHDLDLHAILEMEPSLQTDKTAADAVRNPPGFLQQHHLQHHHHHHHHHLQQQYQQGQQPLQLPPTSQHLQHPQRQQQ